VLFCFWAPGFGAATPTIEKGRAVYNFRCYFCHGYSGDARTLAAEMLKPRPRDFTGTDPTELDTQRMRKAVRDGRPGTAMKPFASILSEQEIGAVIDFVREEFMQRGAPNTRYHSPENGWPDHDRFGAAYPFVRGELPLDSPPDELGPEQRAGRTLFLSSCISCHDIGGRATVAPRWEAEAVSYPRAGFQTGDFLRPPDAVTGATPYARHDIPLELAELNSVEREGERLYLANCAFCHAADGTGKNWIGIFLQPHPRNLTDPTVMAGMTRQRLRQLIREGLPGTSMPAWAGVLAAAEIEALIAYIDRAFYPITDQGTVAEEGL
jgi:cytochrome c oxidase cbb3-type subunit 3